MTTRLSRSISAITIGVIAGLAIATTASAHVEVEVEDGAVAGEPARLVFTVPNERADAATVSIEIEMPQDLDLTDVVPEPVEGWSITTTTRDGDIVDTILWEATGPGLVDEESVELPVAVGPLPAVETLTFPTVQTYDDGEVVRWIEPVPPGEPEPEFPVPTLEISPAAPPETTPPTEPPATEAPIATEPPAATEPTTDVTTAPTEVAVVATAPAETVGVTATTEVSAPPTTVEDGEDDGSAVWPWVVAGIIVVLVGGGVAIAIARSRSNDGSPDDANPQDRSGESD